MKKSDGQKNPKSKASKATAVKSKTVKSKTVKSQTVKSKALKNALSMGIINEKTGLVRAIIETPKGCRNKYKYVPEFDLFECGPALHAGLSWPFDFGFIPSTLAGDGDPLDILVLMDEPAFPGCLVHVKVLGVLEAEQIDDGRTVRNDRVVGVHDQSIQFAEMNSWKDIPLSFRKKIELFFNLNAMCKGKMVELLGWRDSSVAFKAIESCIKATKS